MSNIKEIFKVRFMTDDHETWPAWYPPKGTVGTVVAMDDDGIWVDWPKGSTDEPGPWMCCLEDVEIVGGEGC